MSFPALSWQSCDCHGDLPVTVPQEATALDYDVKGRTLCTLEPEGRSICRVCIISIKEKKQELQFFCSCGATNRSVFE